MKDYLFPEQALNPKKSFIAVNFTDIIHIFDGLIELKELMSNYNTVDTTKTQNIITKLQEVSKDIEDYIDIMRLRFTSTFFFQKMEPKELDDAYWAVLHQDESKLQEYDFRAKFKRATGFKIDDKQGLDPTLTEFEVFKIRLKKAISALRTAFRETQ